MIVKQTESEYSRKEVCRNCQGDGVVPRLVVQEDGKEPQCIKDTCSVCGGRGIVMKHVEVRITISSMSNDSSD